MTLQPLHFLAQRPDNYAYDNSNIIHNTICGVTERGQKRSGRTRSLEFCGITEFPSFLIRVKCQNRLIKLYFISASFHLKIKSIVTSVCMCVYRWITFFLTKIFTFKIKISLYIINQGLLFMNSKNIPMKNSKNEFIFFFL